MLLADPSATPLPSNAQNGVNSTVLVRSCRFFFVTPLRVPCSGIETVSSSMLPFGFLPIIASVAHLYTTSSSIEESLTV